ncbi:MAG: flagellar protein FliT [Acetobacterium woodii]|nr:flagellar protein FliT [Acetobacterium woodii]
MNDYSHEFCQEKILILKEYVTKGEEILSSVEDWESLAGILEERDQLIGKLQELEVYIKLKNSEICCTQEQKREIDNLIKLILDMDQSCIRLIQDEKKKTLKDLKANQQNQKIADYQINLTPNYGTFLDAKK